MKRVTFIAVFIFSAATVMFSQAQYKSKYADIPIVDVHVHINASNDVVNYLKVSDVIKEKYGSNLAFFVGFFGARNETLADVKAAGANRFLFSWSEMRPHKGLTITANEVMGKVREGYIGLKFWFGDPHRVLAEGERGIRLIDDIRFEDFFAGLERGNVLMTSLHIADPNGPFDDRQKWMTDPVYYWQQIRAFENVVAKYPKLTIVAAHCAWIICQDAQIDYLRYMFTTYPNLYVDVSATLNSYMNLVNYDNLRSLYIEFQDRFLYGSDFGRFTEDGIQNTAKLFADNFALLETDLMVGGVKGLNLPKEVLEKIYYKNAAKLYPGLKETMGIR